MRLFCKYKVGDKVLIRYQNKTRVGHIVFDRRICYKYIIIEGTNSIHGPWQLSYRFHKHNIIKRLK